MNGRRLIVIGAHVETVQQVSHYCLHWSSEVLPIYGWFWGEEVELFAPEVIVACAPYIGRLFAGVPYVFWSKQPELQAAVHTERELHDRLRSLFACDATR